MIQRLSFYLMYALRNIQRGGRWTTLAILCITVGVATVVALRSLGLGIGDTLTENVRIETKGDILVYRDRNFSGFGGSEVRTFSPERFEELQNWAEEHDTTTSSFMLGNNVQITKTDAGIFGRPSFIGSYFIDPQTYPPTHTIRTIDPPNMPISELFTGGNDVIISDNLALQSEMSVGDEVRVSGTEELYVVRGIVAASEETSIFNFLNGFFGFAYFDLENAQSTINEEFAPNRMAILFQNPLTEDLEQRYRREIDSIGRLGTTATSDLLARYEIVSQYLGDFVVVMGLGAMLIGGVGIMNTMLVLVRRRTNEIAALKTFGVKAREVASLFLMEALLLGFIGSLLGIIVGMGLSAIVNQYGSVALQQPIVWRIYPEALLFGFTLGMVVTGIFGVAPILTAVKVRPGIILRPNENQIPAFGILQSLVLLVFVTISLGLIVGHIVRPSFELTSARINGERSIEERVVSRLIDDPEEVGLPSPYLAGVLGVGGTFIVFGILIVVIWIIVYLISKFPTFGFVTMRLALRNLSTNRLRTAITLLALSSGMLALSSITFVGEGTRELLNIQLNQTFGGNVLVFPVPGVPSGIVNLGLNTALRDIDIEHRTIIGYYEGELLKLDDEVVAEDIDLSFTIWDSENPDIYSGQASVSQGRMLTADDRGAPIIVIPEETALEYGIDVGSRMMIELDDNTTIELDVMGITSSADGIPSLMGISALIPPDTLPSTTPSRFQLYTYQVPEESLNQALTELSAVIVVFSLDISFVDSLVGRLIEQFASIPTIVGILSLVAAAVIMANTVALATLERRRQIGILKAIGLKSGHVLRVMLIESSIIGLLSAVIGIGTSVLIMTMLTSLGGFIISIPENARWTALALVVISVLIGWMATFLSARVAINERVMNVLRYE